MKVVQDHVRWCAFVLAVVNLCHVLVVMYIVRHNVTVCLACFRRAQMRYGKCRSACPTRNRVPLLPSGSDAHHTS